MRKIKKIMSIDPSGTGTTALFLRNISERYSSMGEITPITNSGFQLENNQKPYAFLQCEASDWEKGFEFIWEAIKEFRPDIILYENTSYIYKRQHQGTVGIYKLLGAIATLKYNFDFLQKVAGVYVSEVKAFRSKVQTGIEEIEGLTYEAGRGKGWKYFGERVSLHEIDALIVYHLWTKKNLPNLEEAEREIAELKAKGKRIGSNQQDRLNKLEKLWKSYQL